MKFASGIFTIALAGGIAVDGMSIRGNTKHANKLMAFSRRLEDSGDSGDSGDEEDANESGDEDNAEDDYSFLQDYSIKLLSCIQGEQVINYENGETESSTVIFRLCPADSCDSSASVLGCDNGYGDYVIGIDTFLEAYMESQRENNDNQYGNSMITYNQWGQQFDASEYVECSEYKQDDEQEQNYYQQQYYQGASGGYGNGNQNTYGGNYYQDTTFYIGPGCSENGTSIALHTYMDDQCTYLFEGNFSSVSPAWQNLPFSEGGLVSMDCISCYDVDEDNNMAVSEMCQQGYESSSARCDNTTTTGCEYVDSLLTSVYGNATMHGDKVVYVFGNTTLDDIKDGIKTGFTNTKDGIKTGFMSTLSNKEAQAFVAVMVVFGLSFFIGASFIGCLCVKKRRKRRQLKKNNQSKLLPSGSDDDVITVPSVESVPPPLDMKKRRSSVVALVRSSTNNIKQSMAAAAIGTKVVVATAVAAVTKNSEKQDEDESIVNSEYNNMEDAIVDTNGSYKAPESTPSFEPTPVSVPSEEELATEPDLDATSEPGEELIADEPAKDEAADADVQKVETVESTGLANSATAIISEAAESEAVEKPLDLPSTPTETEPAPTPVVSEETTEMAVDDAFSEDEASEATEKKTRGSRFLSQMDKHLKKKLSVKKPF